MIEDRETGSFNIYVPGAHWCHARNSFMVGGLVGMYILHPVTRRYFLYASIRALAQVVRRPVPSGAVDPDAVAMKKDGAREPLSLAS